MVSVSFIAVTSAISRRRVESRAFSKCHSRQNPGESSFPGLKYRSILNLVENDVIDDPTLSRDETKEYEFCHQRGCVFFQAHGDGDDAMALIFMCIHCRHKWIG